MTETATDPAAAQRRAQAVACASSVHQCISARINLVIVNGDGQYYFAGNAEKEAFYAACNLLAVTFREFA